jgi:hypothetical protein
MIAGFYFLVKTPKYALNSIKKVRNSVSTINQNYYSTNTI